MFDHDETHGREFRGTLPIPLFPSVRLRFYDFLRFLQRDQDSRYPSYLDGSSSPTFCGYPTPSQLLTRAMLTSQFPFLMLYFPPSPDGSQECIMRAIESLLSFAGCLPPLLWNFRTPFPAVDKSNAHVTVSFLMPYFPHL